MTLWRLVIREIRYRKLNFVLGILSVSLAVGVLVAQLTLLHAFDLRTMQILEAKALETRHSMLALEDDYREITLEMGFNLLVLPQAQDLSEFYATGTTTALMPEDSVHKIAQSNIVTVRHLLPVLEQKIAWPERENRTVFLIGTRGEVPFSHADPKQPLLAAVEPGTIVLGYHLWNPLGLKSGDRITLLGQTFTVAECHPERGTKDDISAWIDLAQAQSIFQKPGRISAVFALKCFCVGNSLEAIRAEISRILPDVHVIEFNAIATARDEARSRAQDAKTAAIEAEAKHRETIRREREAFAAWLVPLVLLVSFAWVGFLALSNVRERIAEIGILRAIGLRSNQVLVVFLTRAVVLGIIGAVVGYGAGLLTGMVSSDTPLESSGLAKLFNPYLLGLVAAFAPLLSALASSIPAAWAAAQDPAFILREE